MRSCQSGPSAWKKSGTSRSMREPYRLDTAGNRHYPYTMNIIRRTLDIDASTDARLRELAAERGQDVAAVLAEAVALLDSVVDIGNPDIAEDRRRLNEFARARAANPLHQVKAWVDSWGTDHELPQPQRIG
jgi:predicted transcriptional regulator